VFGAQCSVTRDVMQKSEFASNVNRAKEEWRYTFLSKGNHAC
jgi:hypothetical protein